MKRFLLAFSGVLLSAFCCIYSFTSSVSALEFTNNAYPLALRWGNVQSSNNGYGFNTTSNGGLDLSISTGMTEGWYTMLSVMFNIPYSIPAGSLITGSIQYCGDDPNGFSGFTSSDTLVLLNQTMMQGMAEWAPGRVCQIFSAVWYSRAEINRNTRVILVDSATGIYLHQGGAIRIPKMGYVALSSGPNYSGSLGDINNKLNGVVSGVGGVQSAVNDVNTSIKDQTESIDNLESSITDSDSSAATDSADSFFSGFTTDTFGLTSVITAPLNLIKNITSSTCSDVAVPLPFVDENISLPCLRDIYEDNFGGFYTMYQVITFGIIAYWVCVRIFNLVKDFKNPEHDEVEVLDL